MRRSENRTRIRLKMPFEDIRRYGEVARRERLRRGQRVMVVTER